MSTVLENDYQGSEKLSPDEIRKALSGDYEGFKFFFEHCLLIQDRDTRQYIHPKMNRGQQMIAKAILAKVSKDTRENKHFELTCVGPRQFGKSTLFTALGFYLESYVPGMERLNTVHTLQTGSTAGKFFKQKIAPIVTNVPNEIFPTIERDTLGTSTLLKFKDIKGIPRGGYYEILSAGSNSVRSGTVSIWLADEPQEYRNPDFVQDAISGAVSSYAWSLTVYIGTFSDRLTDYLLNKIKLGLDHPEEMELIFIPWFLVYGREGDGLEMTEDQLTEYDKEVVIPEMRRWGIPREEWFDKIGWYHSRAFRTSKVKYEFPTSIEDIINITSDRCVFQKESLDAQEKNIMPGTPMRFVTDNATGKVEAQATEVSPFIMYKRPLLGHRYRITIDPITAQSDGTDFFTMIVWDLANNEQVAMFHERGLQDEDYADWAVSMGTIYNKAELCPESNVANGFCVAVNSRRYFRWLYQTKKNKTDRMPGIRTTVSSKELMIDRLGTLLDRNNIIIHSGETLQELRDFVKVIKARPDGTKYVRMLAKGSKHDDLVACCWILAGSLDQAQLEGRRHSGFAII